MVGIVTSSKVKMYEDFDIDNPVIVDDYAVAIKGSDLASFTRKTWEWVLSHQQVVFARTQPEQMLRIVKECQRLGYVVAVTGNLPMVAVLILKATVNGTCIEASECRNRNGRRF